MLIRDFDDKEYLGHFQIGPAQALIGRLSLSRANSTLTVWNDRPFDYNTRISQLDGVLFDNKQVTLVNVYYIGHVTSSPTRARTTFRFNYAVFGDNRSNPMLDNITSVAFSLSDGHILYSRAHHATTKWDAADFITQTASELSLPADINTDNLYVFTWRSQPLALGNYQGHKISITKPVGTSSHIRQGATIDIGVPRIILEPPEPIHFNDAILLLHDARSFFNILFGRHQEFVELLMTYGDSTIIDPSFAVYSPHFKKFDYEPDSPIPGMDLLVDPFDSSHRPNPEFSRVVADWLERQSNWRRSRDMASESLGEFHYDRNRIVRVANAFDHIDSDHIDVDVLIPEELTEVIAKTRLMFKEFQQSPQRDKCLNNIGLMSAPSLKDIVRSRVRLIDEAANTPLPHLKTMAEHAVNCRNYFTHGSRTKIDFVEHANLVIFFSDVLEFVFIASDLIECGWDIRRWMQQGKFNDHPFARFHSDYKNWCQTVLALLEEDSACEQ